MSLLRVTHHTFLERRGGACRVARMLERGARESGADAEHVFETAETRSGSEALKEGGWRERLQTAARQDRIIHLHTTGDWPTVLELLAAAAPKTVLTLHDCSLITGGCAYPLDCALLDHGCRGDCPQAIPGAENRRARTLELLKTVAPALTSPSAWLGSLARKHLGHAVAVVPNGVPWPASVPDKAAAKAALGLAPESRFALFAAHGGEQAGYKGGHLWRKLFAGIKRREPRTVVYMAGGREERREGDLVFWPYVERRTMERFMAAADVFVYPTRADNHPLVVLEAMAAATPVVAQAVGGVLEQVLPGRTGVLVSSGNAEDLAEAVAGLLSSPREASRMGREAFEHGAKHFTAGRMSRAMLAFYERRFPEV